MQLKQIHGYKTISSPFDLNICVFVFLNDVLLYCVVFPLLLKYYSDIYNILNDKCIIEIKGVTVSSLFLY